MNKHKRVLSFLRNLAVIINLISVVFVIGSVDVGFHQLMISVTVLLASLIFTVVIKNADKILRHLIAVGFCLFTALYCATSGIHRYGRIFNKMKYDNGGYVGLYLICLRMYDDYVNGSSKKIVTKKETDREYIEFIKEYPEEYVEHVLNGGHVSVETEREKIREIHVLRCIESDDSTKRHIMGYRKVIKV